MLTVVMLLLLSVVLGMSVFRSFQLPRHLLSGRVRINPRSPWAAALGFRAICCVQLGYTAARFGSGHAGRLPSFIAEMRSLKLCFPEAANRQ